MFLRTGNRDTLIHKHAVGDCRLEMGWAQKGYKCYQFVMYQGKELKYWKRTTIQNIKTEALECPARSKQYRAHLLTTSYAKHMHNTCGNKFIFSRFFCHDKRKVKNDLGTVFSDCAQSKLRKSQNYVVSHICIMIRPINLRERYKMLSSYLRRKYLEANIKI